MSLAVRYIAERGNTVPYPPLFDEIRRNHGFVDLRGRPELVDSVPEAADSPAMRALMLELSDPASQLMTVGCDLGARKLERARANRRFRAGGYVQVATLPLTGPDRPRLQAFAKAAEVRLRADAGPDAWLVAFALCPTHFRFGELLETETLWIWFDAAAAAETTAVGSRERLITSLSAGLGDPGLSPCSPKAVWT